MKKNQSSITATGIAFARAMESTKPEGERVCYDPFAQHFINRAFFHFMRFFVDIGYAEKRGPGVMGFLVVRDRYIDDYVQSCLDDGLEQLVILGAGYDSRAYRFDQLRRCRIFEIDHPATQQVKIEKLKILRSLPDHVVYVPADLARDAREAFV